MMMLMSTLNSFDSVFDDEAPTVCCSDKVANATFSKPKKLQSWSDKVVNATCAKQVKRDLSYKCSCSTQCYSKLIESYETKKECVDVIVQLRTERTEGNATKESRWLFSHLYNGRTRSDGRISVSFQLDGVNVCEEYFTVAMGFTFPNRRIQKYVRLIKVSAFYLPKPFILMHYLVTVLSCMHVYSQACRPAREYVNARFDTLDHYDHNH